MILVDISVWIDHLRQSDTQLAARLARTAEALDLLFSDSLGA